MAATYHAPDHDDAHGGTRGEGGQAGHHGDHQLLLGHGALGEGRHAGADGRQSQGAGHLAERERDDITMTSHTLANHRPLLEVRKGGLFLLMPWRQLPCFQILS